MNREQLMTGLRPFLPPQSIEQIVDWLLEYRVALRITKKRRTKLGDYRPPQKGHGHRISVNGDLNPYAFLNTLVHELAHLVTWEQHRNKVKPHGMAWKNNYKAMLAPFLKQPIFPEDVQQALEQYMTNPAASSCVDVNLQKAFKIYDQPIELPEGLKAVLLEEVVDGGVFALMSGRVFRKGEKLRKRFKCQDVKNGKWYTVSPVTEVVVRVEG